MANERYWVGGATGFLGSQLVAALRARGDEFVACSKSGGTLGPGNEGLEVSAVDVLDRAQVAKSAEGATIALFAVGRVSIAAEDAESLHRLHVLGTERALQGLRDAGVRRVVYASTSGTIAVGLDPERISDERAPAPLEYIHRWPYYRSKLFAEQLALSRNQPGKFEVVVVNPSLLLGPGDLRESSTRDVRLFLEQRIPLAPRGGLSFVDVRDVAQAMLSAGERGQAGERYLLSAQNLTVQDFFERLSRLSGVPAPKLMLPRSVAFAKAAVGTANRWLERLGGKPAVDAVRVEMAQHYWYVNCEKAQRELAFAPREPALTLRDTVLDLVQRGVAFPRVGHFAGARV